MTFHANCLLECAGNVKAYILANISKCRLLKVLLSMQGVEICYENAPSSGGKYYIGHANQYETETN